MRRHDSRGSMTRAARTRRTAAAFVAAIGVLLASTGTATAAPTTTFTPSFGSGSLLGEAGSLTAELAFSGTEYGGFPEPLTSLTIHLPAGAGLSGNGFPTCSENTIRETGPGACPAGSADGPAGSFTAYVAFGNKRVLETGTVETFFAAKEGVLLSIDGHSPVALEFVATGHYEPATVPLGPAVKFSLPFVETVPGAPYVSFSELTVGLGAARSEAGHEVASLTLPGECPSGVFRMRADATFNDETGKHESSTQTEAEAACPSGARRAETKTTLSSSPEAPITGQSVTYTAIVTPRSPSLHVPSGTVTFTDGAVPLSTCAGLAVAPGLSFATAKCTVSPSLGGHEIAARYEGDEAFMGSESQEVLVTVSEPTSNAAKEQAEREARESSERESRARAQAAAAAKKKREEEATAAVVASLKTTVPSPATAAKLASLLRTGGYAFSFTAPAPGVLSVSWYLVPKGAKLSAAAKPVLVAAGGASPSRAGATKIVVRLNPAGRKLLRRRGAIRLTAKDTFTPSGESPVSETGTFLLRK